MFIFLMGVLGISYVSAVQNCKYEASSNYRGDFGYAVVVHGNSDVGCQVGGLWDDWAARVNTYTPLSNSNIYFSTECNMPNVNLDGYIYSQGIKIVEGMPGESPYTNYKICRTPVHGDGLIKCDAGFDGCEVCDDKNIASGDGCSSTGQIENGYTCSYDAGQAKSVCTQISGCPDNICSAEEKKSNPFCSTDCSLTQTCGDNYCNLAYGETSTTCLSDCAKVCTDSQRILRLSSATNSHGAIYSDTAYTYDICYSDIFTGEIYSGATPHTCTANNANTILYLSANSNAHASTTPSIDYTIPICFGDLTCTPRTTCQTGEQILLSLSGTTNAHISAGNDVNYLTKICCSKTTTTCTPLKTCSSQGFDCGLFTDDCGITQNCGTCSLGSCILNKCTLDKQAYWAETNSPLESISEKGVIPDTTKVLLNIANANVALDEAYSFKIYYNEINEVNLIKTISGTVTNIPEGNMLSTEWLISTSDITNKDLNKTFKFVANLGGIDTTGNDLKLNLLDECSFGTTPIIMCADYKDETKCNADLCEVADYNVNSNNPDVTCGQGYSCFCKWDTTDGKCKPGNIKDPITPPVGFDDSWLGTCNYNEDINDDCTDDFLEYKWAGIWNPGTEAVGNFEGDNNFILLTNGNYNYDPLTDNIRESFRCASSSGEKTIPCPTSVKLPFFGFWNFIFAGLFIIGIYLRLLKK